MKEKEQDKFWELATAKIHKEATKEELLELEELLKKDENRKTFREIENIKANVGEVKRLDNFSLFNSWRTISNSKGTRTIKMVWRVARYAAIIVFALFLGSLINLQWNKQNEIVGFAEVKVPLGQMSEMTLYDGTKVWLNSGTTFRYTTDFGKKERNVSLKGEAFFDVAKTGTPFKVKFKNKEVVVLGTKFNVIAYDDENSSQVTLVEGKVNVNNNLGTKIVELKPKEQITIDEISQNAKIEIVETNFYVSWTDGKIVFNEEKLSDIARKLERWYNVDIQFENLSIGELKFSGTILKNKPFDQITKAFEILLPIKIEYTHISGGKDKVYISKKIMPM